MLPSHAKIWCAPYERLREEKEKAFTWSDVYGFDMGALKAYENLSPNPLEPEIAVLTPDRLLTEPRLLCELDLRWTEESEVQTVQDR